MPFIVGSGRSGTTLLRAALSSHPDLAIPPEAEFVAKIVSMRSPPTADQIIELIISSRRFDEWALAPSDIAREVGRASTASEAIRRLYHLYASSRGATRYGDKTPSNVRYLPALARAFPEARFIHVIRDGRDVALSFMQTGFGADRLGEALLRWKIVVSAGREAGASLGPSCYFEIHYEELVNNFPDVLRAICNYIGISFHESMTHYETVVPDLLPAAKLAGHHSQLLRPIGSGRRSDWRLVLSDHERNMAASLVGSTLRSLGYEVDDRSSLLAATHAGFERVRWVVVRVTRRAPKIRSG